MVEIELRLDRSVEQNAEAYFEKAKKAKKKIAKIKEVIADAQVKLDALLLKKDKELELEEKKQVAIKKERKWYEKFHWFVSSEGFLVVCGRDASTNEVVIKNHTDKNDIVFHTETPGSPFCVVKTGGKSTGPDTLSETAQFCGSFSRLWKLGIGNADVFYVNPDQVTKEAKSGEFIAKGAFMVYGKKNFFRGAPLKLAIGVSKEYGLMIGPMNAIRKHCDKYLIVEQGREKASDLAKKITKKLSYNDVDEIIRLLPAGNARIRE